MKKYFLLLVPIIMFSLILSGCGKNDSDEEINSGQPSQINNEKDTNIQLEDPDKVVKELITALLENNYDVLKQRMYFDDECVKLIKDELNLTIDEMWELDQYVSKLYRKSVVNNISIEKIVDEPEKKVYSAEIKYSTIFDEETGPRGETTTEGEFELILFNGEWVSPINKSLDESISVFKNYIGLLDSHEKCLNMGGVDFNIIESNKDYIIDDINHPLNGFSISVSEVNTPYKLTVSCDDIFPKSTQGIIHVGLPIRLSINSGENSYSDLEDYNMSSIIYKIPFNSDAFENEIDYSSIYLLGSLQGESELMGYLNGVYVKDKKARMLAFDIPESIALIAMPGLSEAFLSEEGLSEYSTDLDVDGLSEDDELKYGTDKFNPDTDNDGYIDPIEVKNGYDPLN